MLSTLYAAAARRRREWYASRPDLRRRLRRPVISVGNIAVGGRGKTPFTAFLARLLMELGERPAILSRGYRRSEPSDGAVIVRDAAGIRSDLAHAGDEPLMLARQLPGGIVVTSPDRYVGGRLAELHLGATVHVLDDGFQHFPLDRDIDIVLVAGEDLGARTLPAGRLREPPDVLIAADAIIALDAMERPAIPDAFFRATRQTGAVVFEEGDGSGAGQPFAVVGIANPEPFLAAVRDTCGSPAGVRIFKDHHAYSPGEVARLFAAARAAGASAIVTTEKDYVRLLPFRPFPLPLGYLPLTMNVEPPDAFRAWLSGSLADARDHVHPRPC
jgi:tetraacyldisaccharide 4'-kinase